MAKPVLQQVTSTDLLPLIKWRVRTAFYHACQKSLLAHEAASKCPARDAGNSAFAGLCLACGIDPSGIQAN